MKRPGPRQPSTTNGSGCRPMTRTRLQANDQDMVMSVLSEAFDDNKAPAAPLGVDGDEVSLAVLVPADSAIPDKKPTTTQARNLSSL